MRFCRVLGVFAFAASLTATSASATTMDCHIWLSFGPSKGWYDKPTHDRIKKWLKDQPSRVKVIKTLTMDGSRNLCIAVTSPDDVKPLFEGIKTQLDQQPPTKGWLELISPAGVLYLPDPAPTASRVRGKGYAGDRMPRDNPGRPAPQGARPQ